MIEGTHAEQYAKLWDYCEKVKRTNPDTIMYVKLVDDLDYGQPRFERIYVCLGACKKEFLIGCRPIIGVDGCHLKCPYGGQLLLAMGIDGNNAMFSLAYAVVEGETKSSWIWFLELLQEDHGIKNRSAWTFISDKQKD
ncbi:hypothetical protein F0562_003739 [Nyssa sinensis]|uniref:MULE transposase domain-containing protein n=1 Tax=Nyssa sinensis TaxID=561372 RepID=A0A5J5C0F2_9ASTE|nr:hypothetical protein F0562_003739 [Nyssa sinensis]